MSAERLIDDLRRLGVELSQRDGKLVCNAPKGVLTDELRSRISQTKPDLLRLLRIETQGANSPDAIPIVSRDAQLPLSFSQERIWKLGQIEPQRNVTGNIPFTFRITGPLDTNALGQTIQEIVRRHEVFRASCKIDSGKPTLAIAPSLTLDFPVHDLRHLQSVAKHDEIERMTMAFALAPFDLEKPPLLRVMLIHVDADCYLFLLVTHVFVFDGWSTPILLRELSALYEDFSRNKPLSLPPLLIGYADFAAWHRQWLCGARLNEQKAYWKKILQTASVITTKTVSTNLSSASVPITFPDFLTEAVRELSKQSGVTLFVTLMSVLQTLLQRYTLEPTIAVGTIVSNRRGAATESMIGSFANSILLRSDFPTESTFRSVLLNARNSALTTFSHQDLPIESLLGALDAPITQNPLFPVMFVFHQHSAVDRDGIRFDGLTVDMHPVDKRQSNYLLDLVLTDADGRLSGFLEYNTSAFTRDAAQSFVERYLLILKCVSTNPDRPIDELPTFDDAFARRVTSASVRTPSAASSSFAQLSAVERMVAEIWTRLLRVDVVNTDDDFFELGGHSLAALAVIEEIESRFGITNALDAFAKQRTVASLAKAIESRVLT